MTDLGFITHYLKVCIIRNIEVDIIMIYEQITFCDKRYYCITYVIVYIIIAG